MVKYCNFQSVYKKNLNKPITFDTRKSFLRKKVTFTCSNDEATLRNLMLLLHFTKSLKCYNIDIL